MLVALTIHNPSKFARCANQPLTLDVNMKPVRRRRRSIDTEATDSPLPKARSLSDIKSDRNKIRFLQSLDKNMGLLAVSARAVGITLRTVQRWRITDSDFNEKVHESLHYQRDWVAGKLIENINNGNVVAQKFYLQCKGYGREVPDDWVPRQELVGSEDQPLQHHIRIDRTMSDDALRNAVRDVLAD